MSGTFSRRLLAQSPLTLLSESTPVSRIPAHYMRSFSCSLRRAVEDDTPSSSEPSPAYPTRSPSLYSKARSSTTYTPRSSVRKPSGGVGAGGERERDPRAMSKLLNTFGNFVQKNVDDRKKKGSLYNTQFDAYGNYNILAKQDEKPEPHHFHIYATRHNTHITLTDPKRNPIISLSCGNLGFKHAARKHYDSAFQLASHVMQRMQDGGINSQIKELEVVLRGFGAGREAVTKALLGLEGKMVRHKIVKVADATRLKFGGTRSKKPRRLG